MGSRSNKVVNASPRRRAQSNPSDPGWACSPAWAVVAPSRPRRGEAIWSSTFFKTAAASVEVVNCPVTVPSPWSCSVNRTRARASLLLIAQQPVLVGIDRRPVTLDGRQRPAGGAAQLLRVHHPRLGQQVGLDGRDLLPPTARAATP